MTGTVNRVLGVMILTVAVAAMGSAENPKKKANSDIENIGNRDINKGSINFISLNKEIEMGRELAGQVEEQFKLVKDPIIDEYINRIGQNRLSTRTKSTRLLFPADSFTSIAD